MSNKSKAIEFAVEHFANKGVRKIEVPEWKDTDGNALEIFVSPMTLAEKRRLYKGTKADDIGVLADVLIMKSKDSDGNKLFSLEDKESLMYKVDPDVLSRVAEEIMVAPSIDELEKN